MGRLQQPRAAARGVDAEDIDDGVRLACQSLPVTEVVRAVYE